MKINEKQAGWLAYLLHEIRPDWGPKETKTIILDRGGDSPDLASLIIAATTKALEPSCRTPAPIFQPGTHWPEKARDRLPDAPKCPDHDTEDAHHCRSCLADVAAGERHPNQVGKGKRPHKQPPPQNWRPPSAPKPLPTPRNTPAA